MHSTENNHIPKLAVRLLINDNQKVQSILGEGFVIISNKDEKAASDTDIPEFSLTRMRAVTDAIRILHNWC